MLDSCPYLSISALHWYPTQINGYVFTGRNADTFQLPDALLEVPPPAAGPLPPAACRRLQVTEFTTDHWFLTGDKALALNGKVRPSGAHGIAFIQPRNRRTSLLQSMPLLLY